MFDNILIAPSVTSLLITGIFLLVMFVIFMINFRKIRNLNYYQLLMLLSAITTAIGVHGLLHSVAEVNHNFNPYEWITN